MGNQNCSMLFMIKLHKDDVIQVKYDSVAINRYRQNQNIPTVNYIFHKDVMIDCFHLFSNMKHDDIIQIGTSHGVIHFISRLNSVPVLSYQSKRTKRNKYDQYYIRE